MSKLLAAAGGAAGMGVVSAIVFAMSGERAPETAPPATPAPAVVEAPPAAPVVPVAPAPAPVNPYAAYNPNAIYEGSSIACKAMDHAVVGEEDSAINAAGVKTYSVLKAMRRATEGAGAYSRIVPGTRAEQFAREVMAKSGVAVVDINNMPLGTQFDFGADCYDLNFNANPADDRPLSVAFPG